MSPSLRSKEPTRCTSPCHCDNIQSHTHTHTPRLPVCHSAASTSSPPSAFLSFLKNDCGAFFSDRTSTPSLVRPTCVCFSPPLPSARKADVTRPLVSLMKPRAQGCRVTAEWRFRNNCNAGGRGGGGGGGGGKWEGTREEVMRKSNLLIR